MNQETKFFNHSKAVDLINTSQDPIEKALLQMGLMKVVIMANQPSNQQVGLNDSALPEAPFDLFFYVRVMKELFEPNSRDRMKRIIEGDAIALKDEFEDT